MRPEDKEWQFARFCQTFQEATINFMPTYKFDKRTDTYDTSKKKRVPSWCDRVIWKKSHFITCKNYDSVPSVKFSDHKPVVGLYKVASVL